MDIRLGFTIEEPALFPYHSRIIDFIFLITVACSLKCARNRMILKQPVPKYLLLFIAETKVRTFKVDTILYYTILVLVWTLAQGDKETKSFTI